MELRAVLAPQDPVEGRLAELGPALTRGLTLVAVRALGRADDAREAVQEILARAVEAVRSGRVPADVPLAAFVYGIARHVLADVRRRRLNEGTPLDHEETALEAGQPSPLESLISQEERAHVRWALGQVSDQDRRLLARCFLEGESIQGIAEQSGIPAERLRKRKSRALERLRRLLTARFGHASTSPPTSVI